MADVRSLLKAKRQEARITHPLAVYTDAGALKCLACGPVKHASAWEGHLGSKLHRTTVARLKQEEERRREQEQEEEERRREQEVKLAGKRKAEDSDDSDTEPKRRKLDNGGFPADFFSDPSRAPPPPPSDDEEEDVPMPPAPTSTIDAEWERFQRDVVNAPDNHDAYQDATIVAEPVLASETPEGFPQQQMQTDDAAPEQPNEETTRRQREQDERELIMDRLLDEERAQEEADMKVTLMKNRLDALRRKRDAAKAAKSKAPS
ncbi:hypothetical protein FB45DRAFT_819824 [Roridomyces roridus]|uniref:Coiled-coil domain-containing protein 16 n=1 Tax=Roridomyces roridus TaxID=1738132 RepID=A0AAD7CK23_9AGAR|nr:hypothetical protein FB45DRAFT_819824 [Roridomyces roridus]